MANISALVSPRTPRANNYMRPKPVTSGWYEEQGNLRYGSSYYSNVLTFSGCNSTSCNTVATYSTSTGLGLTWIVNDNQIWNVWNGVVQTSAFTTVTIDELWKYWITTGPGEHVGVPREVIDLNAWEGWVHAQDVEVAERTRVAAERQRAREVYNQQQREEQQRWEIAEAERTAMRARARQLLLGHLTPQQQAEFAQSERFTFTTRSGRVYRILLGSHGNVRVLENGYEAESLCFAPADYSLPYEDVVLAQKISLELDEERTRRVANITNLRGLNRRAA